MNRGDCKKLGSDFYMVRILELCSTKKKEIASLYRSRSSTMFFITLRGERRIIGVG